MASAGLCPSSKDASAALRCSFTPTLVFISLPTTVSSSLSLPPAETIVLMARMESLKLNVPLAATFVVLTLAGDFPSCTHWVNKACSDNSGFAACESPESPLEGTAILEPSELSEASPSKSLPCLAKAENMSRSDKLVSTSFSLPLSSCCPEEPTLEDSIIAVLAFVVSSVFMVSYGLKASSFSSQPTESMVVGDAAIGE
mmetsp:Transcript_8642/g.21242  ORF Transcript_8642/g.21242 Transcript_8642/m.21242 type:complete len:200 (+) Transcript_8642:9996-10595(+)